MVESEIRVIDMRWSECSIQTFREPSHPLEVRAGFRAPRKGPEAPEPTFLLARVRGRIEELARVAGNCRDKLQRAGIASLETAGTFYVRVTGEPNYVLDAASGTLSPLGIATAPFTAPAAADPEGDAAPEEFHTPGCKTIADLSRFTGLPATSLIKSVVLRAGGGPLLCLLRGDHQLSQQKVASLVGTGPGGLAPADAADIRDWFGADPGSLGPVGLRGVRIIADTALQGRHNLIAGANRNDHHLRNVTPGREFACEFADIRQVAAGDPGVELLAARVLSSVRAGFAVLELDAIVETALEQHRDKDGFTWPPAIAPFAAVVTPVNFADTALRDAAERIHAELVALGADALLDDRDERPGVKFKDADLIGFPYRVTVGKKLAEGKVEIFDRRTRAVTGAPVEEAAGTVRSMMGNGA